MEKKDKEENGRSTIFRDAALVRADVALFSVMDGRLLILLESSEEESLLSLISGIIRMEETAEETVERVIKEKTGMNGIRTEQLHAFMEKCGDEEMRTVSIAYLAVAPYKVLPEGLGGGSGGLWLYEAHEKTGRLLLSGQDGRETGEEVLSPVHTQIIKMALERMRKHPEDGDIIFSFLPNPKRFSMPELHEAYEALSGKKTDNGNFSRWVKPRYLKDGAERIRKTGAKFTGKVGRKPDEYELLPDSSEGMARKRKKNAGG